MMITGIIDNFIYNEEKCYCSYDYEKIYSVFSRVFTHKEPPDLDFILLFVIAANVENRRDEIN